MNILLLGSGGRESALAWKIKQSIHCKSLFIAPGNGGTCQYGKNIALSIIDFEAIDKFVLDHQIDILICGPELPAVKGIWDFFQLQNPSLIVIAPSQKAAMLEGSKSFAKKFMAKHHIPTAQYLEINKNNLDEAYQWFEDKNPPYVIKADGLAEGKGVVLPNSAIEARETIDSFITKERFGASSQTVVLEEFLDGMEFSIFVYTNGKDYIMLPNAKDYKRRFEGNKGLNTGGMGCISPVPFVDKTLEDIVKKTIILPTIQGLEENNMPYHGFIYFGLILTKKGPKVIEYNCRLGDPETEVILPRLNSDILELIMAGENDSLAHFDPKISPETCVTVMMVSNGYPEEYKKGYKITGIENISESMVFHASTKLENNQLISNGGRVVAVSSLGETLQDALSQSYKSIDRIRYEGAQYRTDIGFEFI